MGTPPDASPRRTLHGGETSRASLGVHQFAYLEIKPNVAENGNGPAGPVVSDTAREGQAPSSFSDVQRVAAHGRRRDADGSVSRAGGRDTVLPPESEDVFPQPSVLGVGVLEVS